MRRLLLVAPVLSLAAAAAAQVPPFDVPHGERAARYERSADKLTVASVGTPSATVRRMSAKQAAARQDAERRAAAALHRFVDDALSRVRARPWLAQRVHGALERSLHINGARPLVDGGVVLLVEAPAGPLRDAAAIGGVPWAR